MNKLQNPPIIFDYNLSALQENTQFRAGLLRRLDGMISDLICAPGLCAKFADKYVTIFAIVF